MIFLERKKPSVVLSWSILMITLPYVGFVLYLLIGGSLSWKTRRMLKRKVVGGREFKILADEQRYIMENQNEVLGELETKYSPLIKQNLLASDSIISQNNKIEIFTSGPTKIRQLIKDIDGAKKSINISYYIFATDGVGKIILRKLIEKAGKGVEVNLLIDSVGSLRSDRKEFKKLVRAGGKFAEFFPPLFGFRLFNFRLNYRNHRKIVVIDNKIGYTGGINIRDDHMGKHKRLNPWIDMHLRMEGNGVMELQKVFLKDWRYAYKGKDFNDKYINRFFEKSGNDVGCSGVQVVSSGPDEELQYIKNAMIRMILTAKKSIKLITPYFVPDESFMEALRIANSCGIDIEIIVPSIPDKKIVYYTSLSYLRELAQVGVKVYLKRGFTHSKCLIIDEEVSTVGTCNTDVRSFGLNFETNVFIYDLAVTRKLVRIFNGYLNDSILADKLWFKNLPLSIKLAKSVSRLFSAIL